MKLRQKFTRDFKSTVQAVLAVAGYRMTRIPSVNRFPMFPEDQLEKMLRKNTVESYEVLYASDEFTEIYLSEDRLNFYSEVAERASDLSPSKLVDVGCGSGHFLSACSKLMDCQLLGSEITISGVRRTKYLVPMADVRQCSIFEVNDKFEDHKFDLVCCLQVLEHLIAPEKALDELVKMKDEKGKLLITVPDGRKDTWEGHINFWSPESFNHFLSRWGNFNVEILDSDLIAVEA